MISRQWRLLAALAIFSSPLSQQTELMDWIESKGGYVSQLFFERQCKDHQLASNDQSLKMGLSLK